jgi:hypothetical protein
VERLKVIGEWLRRNGEAVYGTRAGPFPRRLSWGRATRKPHAAGGETLYLHVWKWPADNKIVLPGVHTRVTGGRMLAGGVPVTAADSADGLVVTLPAQAPDSPIAVAALEFAEPVTSSMALTSAGTDGRIMLSALDAELSGSDDEKPGVTGSGDAAVLSVRRGWKAQYTFSTPAEAVWAVSAEVSPAAYNRLTVSAPGPFGRSATSAVQGWCSGPGHFITVELGVLRLSAGANALELKSEMEDVRPLEIRRVWLAPVK